MANLKIKVGENLHLDYTKGRHLPDCFLNGRLDFLKRLRIFSIDV